MVLALGKATGETWLPRLTRALETSASLFGRASTPEPVTSQAGGIFAGGGLSVLLRDRLRMFAGRARDRGGRGR